MLDISVNPGLLWVHADLDCIINRPEILFINHSTNEFMKNVNSHRFTGTKMFNRQAGDGLILVVRNIEMLDSESAIKVRKGKHLTRLVISALSNLYRGNCL